MVLGPIFMVVDPLYIVLAPGSLYWPLLWVLTGSWVFSNRFLGPLSKDLGRLYKVVDPGSSQGPGSTFFVMPFSSSL